MKRRILLIVGNMESGGVSKSMSSLLNVIDTNKYEVDCFILVPKGIFMHNIPSPIRLIDDKRTSLIAERYFTSIRGLLRNGYLFDGLLRTVAAFFMLFNKGIGGWILSRRIKKINKEYDLAVDFNGQLQLYYLIDRIYAKKKVTFIHSDYAKWDYYYSMDKKYMPKADKIFTISKQCVQSLKRYFPECHSKIELFENISSPVLIKEKANETPDSSFDFDGVRLLTIGHVSENKGTDIAIKAANILKQRGFDFHWYFIGLNTAPELFKQMINENNVKDKITFMGIKANPYPYIQQADIVVHPSRFEGKSIALDEAKILAKPIVVTNFSTVNDQFENRVNASICEMNELALANAIEELLMDTSLRDRYTRALSKTNLDNTGEINKLYQLLN